jgi:hypothetical protein
VRGNFEKLWIYLCLEVGMKFMGVHIIHPQTHQYALLNTTSHMSIIPQQSNLREKELNPSFSNSSKKIEEE